MTGNNGIPFTGFTPAERERYKIIVSDVDDTITKNGKLHPAALKALWDLKNSGRTIILVTGGSVGWADAYLRQWPVDAVITESGAVMICLSKEGEVIHVTNPAINRDAVLKKRAELLKVTSGLKFSSDQPARVFDVAYDKKKMDPMEVKVLKNTLSIMGANYAESSIHINAWFGDYDKKKAVKHFFQGPLEMKEDYYLEHSLYLGDSFNDQPLFGYIPTSIGMHTVQDQREKFDILPTYITEGGPGDGFCEVTKALVGC